MRFDNDRLSDDFSKYVELINNGVDLKAKLSPKKQEALGKKLTVAQKKSIWDQIVSFLSHFNTATRKIYLKHRFNKFVDHVKNTPSKSVILKIQGIVDNTVITKPSQAATFKHEGLSKKSQLNLMESTLDLRWNPDDSSKTATLYDQKRRLMANEIHDSSVVGTLVHQSKQFPIMQAAIGELATSYKKWDHLSDDQVARQQFRIHVQHQNLEALADLLHRVEDTNTLMQVGMTEDLKKALHPYITGKKMITPYAKKELFNKLQEEICKIKEESTEQKKKKFPVSETSIKMEADLFKAIRQDQASVVKKNKLKKFGDSANDVYKLPGTFYKESAGGEQAAGVMEKLMWDIAVRMGVEKDYTPTIEAKLRTKKELKGGKEEARIWTKEGDLKVVKGAQKARQGGIQLAQPGTIFWKHLEKVENEDANPLSRNEITRALMTALKMGMFDAHGGNMIINDKGEIKYFDNTRSLPHSNEVIEWQGGLTSAFRSSLLELDDSYEELTTKEREALKQDIEEFQAQLPALEQFLRSSQTEGQLKKLPPGWFNVDDALSALKERVDRLAAAVSSANNLSDLVFAVNPSFKFFGVMEILLNGLDEDYEWFPTTPMNSLEIDNYIKNMSSEDIISYAMSSFGSVGYTSIDEIIEKVSELKIDPLLIKQWCEDPTLSLEDIVKNVLRAYFYRQTSPETPEEAEEREMHAASIIEELQAKAKFDCKDANRNDIPDYAINNAEAKFEKVNIEINWDWDQDQINSHFEKLPPYEHIIVADGSTPRKLTLYFKSLSGKIRKKKIDYLTQPGQLKVEGATVSPEELRALACPSYYHSQLNRKGANELLEDAPEGSWLLRPGTAVAGSLVLSVVRDGKVEHHTYKQDPESTSFFDKKKELHTIKDIVAQMEAEKAIHSH